MSALLARPHLTNCAYHFAFRFLPISTVLFALYYARVQDTISFL